MSESKLSEETEAFVRRLATELTKEQKEKAQAHPAVELFYQNPPPVKNKEE